MADCDNWPFDGLETKFALADFDAYSNPYQALVTFWKHADKASRVLIFGTDGNLQTINRGKRLVKLPTNTGPICNDRNKIRDLYNKWWSVTVKTFLMQTIAPYRISYQMRYRRGTGMLYWGIVAEL